MYTIPDNVKSEMRQLAAGSGLPYATIVNQRLYDLRNLADTLQTALKEARQAIPGNLPLIANLEPHVRDIESKLAACEEQIHAYQREIASASS